MASLADKAILSGADNRPPMLEKDMYDSWKSRMKLYILNRPHGRMILESVEQGPLIWPSMEVEGVKRLKKYSELSVAKAIQADCDVKATNIILQGLPPEVYALVSTHKVAKELWERIQMLMQGTMILESVEQGPLNWPSVEVEGVTRLKKYSELSAAEAIQADCDVKATNIILQGLPPEVYALVSTHKVAKELWERIQMLMQGTSLTKQERECKLYDAFDKFAYQKGEPLRTDTSSFVNHNAYMASSLSPQVAYASMDQQSSEYSPPEAGLVVPVFQKEDDPIDAINHMMSFVTSVVASRYPATNNQ
nr:hypothetical protein [Tanacetum cinerariifolium]